MNENVFISQIFSSGNWWVINKPLARIIGHTETIYFMELIYQQDIAIANKTILADGFFPCPQEFVEENTAIIERSQRRYCKKLEKMGLVKTQRVDNQFKYYKIHAQKVWELLEKQDNKSTGQKVRRAPDSTPPDKKSDDHGTKSPQSTGQKVRSLNKESFKEDQKNVVVAVASESVQKLALKYRVTPMFFQQVIDTHQLISFAELEKAIAALESNKETKNIIGTLKSGKFCFYNGECTLIDPSPPAQAEAESTWQHVLTKIEQQINTPSFNTWLRPVQFGGQQNDTITLFVPNETFAYWLKEYYTKLITDTWQSITKQQVNVTFQVQISI